MQERADLGVVVWTLRDQVEALLDLCATKNDLTYWKALLSSLSAVQQTVNTIRNTAKQHTERLS